MTLLLCFSLLASVAFASSHSPPQLHIRQKAPDPILEVIQITPSVKIPSNATCTVNLMEYVFGFSYGKPFVGDYKPPNCDFNKVVMNFTTTSKGRQFDRLALMYFNDTEVWRTSTAEPTTNGIIWTHIKDMSHYLSLWKQPQKLIFDLGNLIDDKYTGSFNTTLTATFFNSNTTQPPADLIVPVSKRKGSKNEASAFRIPDDGAATSKFIIPQNAKAAVFSISACGQGDEEFWWSNVPQSTVNIFGNNSMPGYSPWRELQLWIDGKLTGVTWPFPIIFTGGVVPQFWRPLVGIDAFDLKEDEIDITPWLPVLSDGKEHSYEIKVVGLDDTGSGKPTLSKVASNWIITGKLFLWLDKAGSVTKGNPPKVIIPEPEFMFEILPTKNGDGSTNGLLYKVIATRNLTIDGSITTSEGTKTTGWKQTLDFINAGNITEEGLNQTNVQRTIGSELSGSGYSRNFKYPLDCSSSTKLDKNTKEIYLGGKLTFGKLSQILGQPVFPTGQDEFDSKGQPVALGVTTNTTQIGDAWYHSNPAKNQTTGGGLTEQILTFEREFGNLAKYPTPSVPDQGRKESLYSRHILAKNNRIDKDEEIQLDEYDPQGEPPIRIVESITPIETYLPEDLQRAGGQRFRQLFKSRYHS